MKELVEKKAEKDKDKETKKAEKLQKLKTALHSKPKHQFNDPEYEKQRSLIPERVFSAVEEGKLDVATLRWKSLVAFVRSILLRKRGSLGKDFANKVRSHRRYIAMRGWSLWHSVMFRVSNMSSRDNRNLRRLDAISGSFLFDGYFGSLSLFFPLLVASGVHTRQSSLIGKGNVRNKTEKRTTISYWTLPMVPRYKLTI